MAVHKALARLRATDGALVGEGRAYIHLRQAETERQAAQGTVSLDWWDDGAPAPASLELDGGRTLPIEVSSDRLSGCMVGRILRYRLEWPGATS